MTTKLQTGDPAPQSGQSGPTVLYAWIGENLRDGAHLCVATARRGEESNIFPGGIGYGSWSHARLRPEDARQLRALLDAFLGDSDKAPADLERSIVEHMLQAARLKTSRRYFDERGNIVQVAASDVVELATTFFDRAASDAERLLVARSRKP